MRDLIMKIPSHLHELTVREAYELGWERALAAPARFAFLSTIAISPPTKTRKEVLMPEPKALTPMFNALEEPFPMIEDRDGRLVAAVKDYAYAKKSAQMLNDILDTAVAAERERVLAEIDEAAESVFRMEYTAGERNITGDYDEGWDITPQDGGPVRRSRIERLTVALGIPANPQKDTDK